MIRSTAILMALCALTLGAAPAALAVPIVLQADYENGVSITFTYDDLDGDSTDGLCAAGLCSIVAVTASDMGALFGGPAPTTTPQGYTAQPSLGTYDAASSYVTATTFFLQFSALDVYPNSNNRDYATFSESVAGATDTFCTGDWVPTQPSCAGTHVSRYTRPNARLVGAVPAPAGLPLSLTVLGAALGFLRGTRPVQPGRRAVA